MKETEAESRDCEEAKKRLKAWLADHPEIANDLKPEDLTIEACRIEGGTLFRTAGCLRGFIHGAKI